jgi:hypothetical protein
MTARKPLVIVTGRKQEIPVGDIFDVPAVQKMSVATGETLTIPAGYCYVTSGPFDAEGTVDAEGVLEIL